MERPHRPAMMSLAQANVRKTENAAVRLALAADVSLDFSRAVMNTVLDAEQPVLAAHNGREGELESENDQTTDAQRRQPVPPSAPLRPDNFERHIATMERHYGQAMRSLDHHIDYLIDCRADLVKAHVLLEARKWREAQEAIAKIRGALDDMDEPAIKGGRSDASESASEVVSSLRSLIHWHGGASC